MLTLLNCFRDNPPPGFVEGISYGMIIFSILLSVYLKGYHATPGQPLPFINFASKKRHIDHHIGINMSAPMLEWLRAEYPRHSATRLDMGKSSILFKQPGQIPLTLIAALARKITVEEMWGFMRG